jgi:hypothetical protein
VVETMAKKARNQANGELPNMRLDMDLIKYAREKGQKTNPIPPQRCVIATGRSSDADLPNNRIRRVRRIGAALPAVRPLATTQPQGIWRGIE